MKKLKVLTAFDQKPMAELNYNTEEEAFAKIERAHEVFLDRPNWPKPFNRVSILEKALELIKERKEDLILDAAKEGGKPYLDSKVEIERGIEGIKIALKELAHMHGTEVPMNLTPSSDGRRAWTRKEPRGVALGISAFNHPFNLIIHQVIPAIAVGCPVIIKPASSTPVSCKNLVEILYEAGLDKAWCQMVICTNEVAEKMVSHPKVTFLSFIGSATVGWRLRSKLAPGATCVLEHGGVAPVIVDKTANLETTIPSLLKGGFYHAGQVCVSVQRIFIHEDVEKEFIRNFVEGVKKLKVGDPTSETTEVGPLISTKDVDRVDQWVKEAVDDDGEILCGGNKISDTCFEPTVIYNPSIHSTVSTSEVFGPVVCIYPYNDIKDAVERANSVDFAFQGSIFTNDLSIAEYVTKYMEGLTIMVNDHSAFRVDWMPFGGYKKSGLGVGGIGHTMNDMTLEKMTVIKF
ncbi:MAG: aldehyde dehydrogenase [Epsilonproteobacteria bacterium]|nr:MAG: aldehyde dehydrogenase [Campylobacterota bacterium]